MPTYYGSRTLTNLFDRTRSAPNSAYKSLAVDFIGFRARANYRSPETIARYILRVLPFDFVPSNPLPGLGVGVATYKMPEDQSRRVAAIVTELIRTGFRHSDIVLLSMRGLARATFAQQKRVGAFTLSRPTGEYDLLGNQLFANGQLRFDTVYQFKGQQAPAIIITDVDPDQEQLDRAQRLLFTAMTRATVRLEIVLREGNRAARATHECLRGQPLRLSAIPRTARSAALLLRQIRPSSRKRRPALASHFFQ